MVNLCEISLIWTDNDMVGVCNWEISDPRLTRWVNLCVYLLFKSYCFHRLRHHRPLSRPHPERSDDYPTAASGSNWKEILFYNCSCCCCCYNKSCKWGTRRARTVSNGDTTPYATYSDPSTTTATWSPQLSQRSEWNALAIWILKQCMYFEFKLGRRICICRQSIITFRDSNRADCKFICKIQKYSCKYVDSVDEINMSAIHIQIGEKFQCAQNIVRNE